MVHETNNKTLNRLLGLAKVIGTENYVEGIFQNLANGDGIPDLEEGEIAKFIVEEEPVLLIGIGYIGLNKCNLVFVEQTPDIVHLHFPSGYLLGGDEVISAMASLDEVGVRKWVAKVIGDIAFSSTDWVERARILNPWAVV